MAVGVGSLDKSSDFFAGRFMKETAPGEDVDYVSTWLTFRI